MLTIEQLSKTFGDIQAVKDVSFQVNRGRLVGFLGPNGAGKSTTMRSIFGLVEPDGGTVKWQGSPAADCLSRFGYMPEQRGLYPSMKAGQQVAFFGELKGLPPSEALHNAKVLLDEFGLSERLNDEVQKLSHGNQQRVQLACSMVHNPDVLVLDEPFSGLDPVAVETMRDVLIERARSGVAVLFSSHQLELVERLCDDVVIIADGSVRIQGSMAEVRQSIDKRWVRIELARPGDELREALADHLVTDLTDRSAVVSVSGPEDLPLLLNRVQQAGEVSTFAFEAPTLTEIFSEVV